MIAQCLTLADPGYLLTFSARLIDVFHKLQYEIIPALLELNKQPLKVYLALCQYADIETGVCWPGYARLKKECKIDSGRDMKKAIDKLVTEKLIGTWMVGNKRHYQVL